MEISQLSVQPEGRLADVIAKVRGVILRRWLTLVLVSGVIIALGVAATLLMTPKYSAAARVQIDPSRNPLAGTQAGGNGDSSLTPEAISTEVEAIRSLALARQIVRKLNLVNDPEYAALLRAAPSASSMSADDRETLLANALLGQLSVNREKLTYILSVAFTSVDPAKAARIANEFAEGYIRSKIGSNVGTAEQQSEWYRQRLDALSRDVQEADAKVASYRARTGIVTTSGNSTTTASDQQVGPLAIQMATAESEAAAASANLDAAREQIRRAGSDSVAEVLNSEVIRELRRQRAEILRNMGEVQTRYGEKHPETIRVRDQLDSIDQQIREESARVVSSLQATAQAAEARASSLRGAMQRLQGRQAEDTRNAMLADSLDREAGAKRAQYQKLSEMSLASSQQAQNSLAQAKVIDRAQIPTAPSSPNKPLFFALSFIVGIAGAAGLVTVQELAVSGLRTVDELETRVGLPLLTAIPKVPKKKNPADLLLETPTSLFAESFRIARAAILGVKTGPTPQVIAITSALPSEGKTTTALSFARTLAVANAKTLLIECDVRRAAMRFSVGQPNTGPGLVEVLHGEANVDDAITAGDVPGLDHLLVRSPYFSSEDLFGAGKMEKIIGEMRKRYELIVLDLPPLVGLADGRYLAVLAEVTALVVKWDSTPIQAISSAVSWLKTDGANPVGAIFTMVDSSAEAIGGLYYSKKYSGYYQTS